MKRKNSIVPKLAVSLALGLGLVPLMPSQLLRADTKLEEQKKQSQQQANPEVEKQRKDSQQQAEKTLDKDAMAAIDETTKAIKAIADNKTDEALAALERATGKINILVARNPAKALIPVATEVEVIEGAPEDLQAIKAHARAVEKAVDDKDYPAARVLMLGLTSEIRVRTENLPLATYPAAMRDAARLLEQKKTKEANEVLLTALNTLVVVDRVTPLPVALAQDAINEAQALRDKDKARAQKLLSVARHELERAKELGYAGKDPMYAELNRSISNIEKQLRGNEDTGSSFAKLKDRVHAFFQQHSEGRRSG